MPSTTADKGAADAGGAPSAAAAVARSIYAPPVIVAPSAADAAASAAAVARNYSLRWWEVGALTFPVAALTQISALPFLVHGVDHRPALSWAQVRADPALPWRGHWVEMRHNTLRLTGLFGAKQFLRSAFDIFDAPSSTLEDFSRNFAAGGLAGLTMTLPWYMTELHEKRMTNGSRTAKLPPGTWGRGWDMKTNPASIRMIEFTKRNGWFGRGSAHAGVGLASMREIVHRGLYFGLYDTVTAHNSDLGYAPRLALAYAVAFGSNVVAHPLAEIHERTQYWRGPTRKFVNVVHAYKRLTMGNPLTLWKGSMGRLTRTAVPHALLLVGVDAMKQLYTRLRARDDALPTPALATDPAAKTARVHYPIAGTSKPAATTTAVAAQATSETAATS